MFSILFEVTIGLPDSITLIVDYLNRTFSVPYKKPMFILFITLIVSSFSVFYNRRGTLKNVVTK